MIAPTELLRLQQCVVVACGLLDELSTATEGALDALRRADPGRSLESALDARERLLPRSAAALEELAAARRLLPPAALSRARAVLEPAERAARACQALDAALNVALTALRDQARDELGALDRAGARGGGYLAARSGQRATIDITR